MIIGIGSDLCDIRRIEKTVNRFGDRFTRRVFTDGERERAQRREPVSSYARRWAAKEACSKALGTGLCTGVACRQIEIVNLESGQPSLRLHGGAAARLEQMRPAGAEMRLHLTMSDDPPYALAFVVIEATPSK
ncbi:MAG: holo-ACP synthase [Neomegalonema sp.]|nr:holo-ACP synthase [Neomegalonema sp.]